MQADLFDNLNPASPPKPQADFFTKSYLKELYHEKLALSQAAGRDGIRPVHFEKALEQELAIIERKVSTGAYRLTPYKERLISKGHDKNPRQISIPTIRDRILLRACCEVLHKFIPNSIGSPPHKVIKNVIDSLKDTPEDHHFVRLDIKNFFPSVPHIKLLRLLQKNGLESEALSLIYSALKAPTSYGDSINKCGIPQGLSISGALAQIYMQPIDKLQTKNNLKIFRYVDDILIICAPEKSAETFRKVKRSLATKGLKAHALGSGDKSSISEVRSGIEFLGYSISKNDSLPLEKQIQVQIKDASYRKMFKNIMKVLTDFKYSKESHNDHIKAVWRINLKITGCIVNNKRRGWLMFFSKTKNMSQLKYLDDFIKSKIEKHKINQELIPHIKTFIKSYHEINFATKSKYIPNFDEYTIEKKKQVLSVFKNRTMHEIESMQTSYIISEFNKIIYAEIKSLEEDVGNVS